jgi:hypothetical protein
MDTLLYQHPYRRAEPGTAVIANHVSATAVANGLVAGFVVIKIMGSDFCGDLGQLPLLRCKSAPRAPSLADLIELPQSSPSLIFQAKARDRKC